MFLPLPNTSKIAKSLGVIHYFTGKPCKRGHASVRLSSNNKCLECSRIHCRKYLSQNRKKEAERRKVYRIENIEREAEYGRKYKSENRDKISKYNSIYYHKNKDKIREYNSIYHNKRMEDEDFRDKKRRLASFWIKQNSAKSNASKAARRNSLRASGTITSQMVVEIMGNQKGRCANPACKKNISTGKPNSYHIDHIFPVSKGGDNHKTNIQLLCPRCNLSKSAKDPFDWANQNGFLL